MAVMLSEKAANEVKRIMQEQKLGPETRAARGRGRRRLQRFPIQPGLRQGVRREDRLASTSATACRSWSTRRAPLYLDGTTVDFYDGLEKRGFTFDNPNAVKSCGCGSSFQA